MKIGVSAFAWDRTFTKRHLKLIPHLKKHGIDHIEVPLSNLGEFPARALRDAVSSEGLTVSICALLPMTINPLSQNPMDQEMALGHLRRCIDLAYDSGSVLIGGPIYSPNGFATERRRTEAEWERAVRLFRALCASLNGSALTLTVEPVNRSESNFMKTSEEAKQFCEEVGHPNLGVTIDTFHANIEESDTSSSVHRLNSLLRHVHMSENDRGVLGSGHVPFASIYKALVDISYSGLLVIEGFGYSHEEGSLGAIWSPPSLSPDMIAVEGYAYLQSLQQIFDASA